MSDTLDGYITSTRRLLHDVGANFWTNAELIDYINEGRNNLVRDSGCNRVLQDYNAPVGVETIDFTLLPQGRKTLDVLNINLYWGNSRVPMYSMSWTEFNSQMRFWQNYNGRPIAFAMYGPKKIFIGPKPDQVYQLELDTVVEVDPLIGLNDIDTLPGPFTEAVPFYAAYMAKYQEQSYGEAEIFKQEYTKQILNALNTSFTRRMPTPYVAGY